MNFLEKLRYNEAAGTSPAPFPEFVNSQRGFNQVDALTRARAIWSAGARYRIHRRDEMCTDCHIFPFRANSVATFSS